MGFKIIVYNIINFLLICTSFQFAYLRVGERIHFFNDKKFTYEANYRSKISFPSHYNRLKPSVFSLFMSKSASPSSSKSAYSSSLKSKSSQPRNNYASNKANLQNAYNKNETSKFSKMLMQIAKSHNNDDYTPFLIPLLRDLIPTMGGTAACGIYI